MIKAFCDMCGAEITEKNKCQPLRRQTWNNQVVPDEQLGKIESRLGRSTCLPGKTKLTFSVYVNYVCAEVPGTHVCRYCLFDVIRTIDDREKVVISAQQTVEDHG